MNPDKIAFGTCDGTGAIINVCCGFRPHYVKVWNHDAADTPSIEWADNMRGIATGDEGTKIMGASDTDMDRVRLDAAGIAPYAGGDQIEFLSAVHPHWVVVGATADVSEVYVDGHYKRNSTTPAAFKSIGDKLLGRTPTAADYGTKFFTPEGFVIGADTDVNADGEQLSWMAIG